MREDYSADGDAWSYFPHDHARSRAYRWNEDGIAGICDRHQYLCFALALWNGRDPFLKERLFGLTGNEGNHGEDVKEYYFYLDNTPTHSYMKYLVQVPAGGVSVRAARRGKPAADAGTIPNMSWSTPASSTRTAISTSWSNTPSAMPEDLLIRISITNRGPEAAPIHVLPTLWFRNTWSWGRDPRRPSIAAGPDGGYGSKASYAR